MATEVIGLEIQTNLGGLRSQLKEATAEVQKLSQKFGESSKEANEAAMKAAKIKDAIGDANTKIAAFNPDRKFAAFSQSIQGVAGAFAGMQGAMGLMGIESENVQKQLLKVQSALAFSEGLNTFLDTGIDGFKNLGTAISDTASKAIKQLVISFSTLKGAMIATGIGALAVGVGLLIANFDKLKAAISGITKEQELYNEVHNESAKVAEDYKAKVADVSVALKAAKDGVISKEQALENYNKTLGDTLGKEETLEGAENAMTKRLPIYLETLRLKTEAQALRAKAADIATKIETGEAGELSVLEGLGAIFKNLIKGGTEVGLILTVAEKSINKANEAQSQANKLNEKANQLTEQTLVGEGKLDVFRKKVKIETPLKDTEKKFKGGAEKEITADPALLLQNSLNEAAAAQHIKNLDVIDKNHTLLQDVNIQNRKRLADQEIEDRKLRLQEVGVAIQSLTTIVGKDTVAGKALGIATATINTYQGASEALKQKSTLPSPFDVIAKIVNVTAIIATGLRTVSSIARVQVPGGGGGGTPSLAPITPTLPISSTITQLSQSSINQLGSGAMRAYVVETDIRTGQERQRRIDRAARII